MYVWVWGLTFSLLVGHIVTSSFLSILRAAVNLPEKPSHAGGRTSVPPGFVGLFERLLFTIWLGLSPDNLPQVATASAAWLALKMASNWNHPDWKGTPDARTYALTALMAGVVSIATAIIGGRICDGQIALPMVMGSEVESFEFGTLAQWAGAIGTIGAVVVALFKDEFLRWRRKARLQLSVVLRPPDCHLTTLSATGLPTRHAPAFL